MYGGSVKDFSPITLDDASRWVQQLTEFDYAWIIQTDSFIGHIRLDKVDTTDRRASLAIGIDDAGCIGKGLGPEAINLVQRFAFDQLKLHRLSLRVLAFNTRAIRAYEKCGFKVEGKEREAALVDGKWHDDVIMGILSYEFESKY
jgi:RimJ/RimL family protein N-acetyltransferase